MSSYGYRGPGPGPPPTFQSYGPPNPQFRPPQQNLAGPRIQLNGSSMPGTPVNPRPQSQLPMQQFNGPRYPVVPNYGPQVHHHGPQIHQNPHGPVPINQVGPAPVHTYNPHGSKPVPY